MKPLTTAAVFWLFVLSSSVFAQAGSVSAVKATVLPHWYRHDKGPSRLVRLELVGGKLTEPASVAVEFGKKRFVREVAPGDKPLAAVDVYLPIENPAKAAPEEKKKFIEAARKGYIHQDVLYAQVMTGICSTHIQE